MVTVLRGMLSGKPVAALLATVLLTLGGCQSFPPPQSASVHTELSYYSQLETTLVARTSV